MKKYLPFLILILSFSGFISTQIVWDIFNIKAEQATSEDKRKTSFENLFKNLALEDTNKNKIDVAKLKSPIVILNFWASWCIPCLKEFPSLVELQKKFPQDISVIGINGDEEDADSQIKKVVNKYQLNFPQVLDSTSTIADKFLITTYPFSIVYHNGKVLNVHTKTANFMDTEFINQINFLLKK